MVAVNSNHHSLFQLKESEWFVRDTISNNLIHIKGSTVEKQVLALQSKGDNLLHHQNFEIIFFCIFFFNSFLFPFLVSESGVMSLRWHEQPVQWADNLPKTFHFALTKRILKSLFNWKGTRETLDLTYFCQTFISNGEANKIMSLPLKNPGLTGISRAQASPPSLQFNWMAILVETLINICFLLIVRPTITWEGTEIK